MNAIQISGNLVRDVELKTTVEGLSVCSFTVAVRRPNAPDKTDFINCTAWRNTAEFISRWFKKGKWIEVSGALTSRSWEDSAGSRRTSFEVTVREVSFGGGKKEESGAEPSNEIPPDVILSDEDLPF